MLTSAYLGKTMKRKPTFLAGTVIAAVLIFWLQASTERTPPARIGEMSSTPDSSLQRDGTPEATPSTNLVTTQDEHETSRTEIASEETAISPEPELFDGGDYQVDRPNPFDLRSEFANEIVDIDWGPTAERDIRGHLSDVLAARLEFGERYALTTVRCRSTLCEAVFTDFNNHQDPGSSIFRGNLHMSDLELLDKPWYARFDRLETKMLYMPSSGVLEQRLYLRRAGADNSPN
jgi:hypothetical protein